MAVTKRTAANRKAEQNIKNEDTLDFAKKLKRPEGERNIDIIRSLTHDDACDWVEHIILLRVVHGQNGFLNDQFNFKTLLDEEWKAVEKFGMLGMFQGRYHGFGHEWLTINMWNKLKNCNETDFARWVSMINLMPWYIKEIIKGKKHQLTLCDRPQEQIVLWLNERNGVE